MDATFVLEATAHTLLRAFARHRVAAQPERAQALRVLRRELALRCRLERERLLPALREAFDGPLAIGDDAELDALRALAARLVPVADPYDERQTALLSLLEGAVRQRLRQVESVVAFGCREGRLDPFGLGRVLMRALDAWSAWPYGH
ncbi:MAG: hypothetical protein MZW92_26355 [Comamonadaceae bacterium]|nr:hypothetical protein [Comamonadaceae bacterium]